MNLLSKDWLYAIFAGVGVFILSYNYYDQIVEKLKSKSLNSRDHIMQRLDLMFIKTDEKKVTLAMLAFSFGFGFLSFLIVWPKVILGVIIGTIVTGIGFGLPKRIVDFLYNSRCKKFGAQLVDALNIMRNGIKSGLSVSQSIERVTFNMPNPVNQEFTLVLNQTRLGLSVEEALNDLANRIPIPDVQMVVTSINILKETGGNLAETFETISETIRERQKITKKIEAMTQQGLMQAIIISGLPFVLLFTLTMTDPKMMDPLFNSTLGIIMILFMLALQAVGGFFIKKIMTIRV